MSRLNVDQIYTRTGTGSPAIREMPIVNLAALISPGQTVTSNAWTKLTVLGNTKYAPYETDTNNFWSDSENKLIPTIPGWYEISYLAQLNGTSQTLNAIAVARNGAGVLANADVLISGVYRISTSSNVSPRVTGIMYFNGSTDYAELFANIAATSPNVSFVVLSAHLIRPD